MADDLETALTWAARLAGLAALALPFIGVPVAVLSVVTLVGKIASAGADAIPTFSPLVTYLENQARAGTITADHISAAHETIDAYFARPQGGRSEGYSPS